MAVAQGELTVFGEKRFSGNQVTPRASAVQFLSFGYFGSGHGQFFTVFMPAYSTS